MLTYVSIAFSCILALSLSSADILDGNNVDPSATSTSQDTINPNEVREATGPEWPDEIPLDIPEFSEGTMVSAVCNDPDLRTSWTIIYNDVIKNALSNYKDLFRANDFKTSDIIRKNGSSKLTATQDGIKVVCVERKNIIELTIITAF